MKHLYGTLIKPITRILFEEFCLVVLNVCGLMVCALAPLYHSYITKSFECQSQSRATPSTAGDTGRTPYNGQ